MKAFLTAACALCLVGFLAVGAEDKKAADPKDNKGPEGRYTIVSEEMGGKPGDAHKGGYFSFDKGKFGGYGSDKKMFFGGDYKIDTTKTPNTITWTNDKGEKMTGIIEQRGDDLRIYYAMPGGTAPTGFDKTSDKQGGFTLRRDKTGGTGEKDKKNPDRKDP